MERTVVLNKLSIIFRKVLNNESLVLSNDLTANDVNNWDSLTHMLLITEIENSFSIRFKLRDLNKLRNVGDMIEMIISKL